MSNPNNTLRGWLATAALTAGALGIYLATALAASLLSGSAVVGAVASNAVIFTAGLFWLRSERRKGHFPARTAVPGVQGRTTGFWSLVVLALVFCWIVGQATSLWLYSYLGSPGFDQHTSAKTGSPVLLMLLVVLVLAPMGEEMLIRGIAYSRLRRHIPPFAAAVLTAGVFSLMHLNLVQAAATLPLGLLLAAVYEHTGRIAPVILMHVMFNLLSVAVPASLVTGFASLTFVMLGGVVLSVLLALLYRPPAARTEKDPAVPVTMN